MKKKPDVRYENNYRYTPKQMKGLWKKFFIGWGISIGLGVIFIVIFGAYIAAKYDPNGSGDPYPDWANTLGVVAILLTVLGFPLLSSAWLGGRAIHRWGPLGTVTAVVGLMVAASGSSFGQLYMIIGVILLVVGVIITFYLGKIADVPIWLQLPILKSPRLYLNEPTPKPAKKMTKKSRSSN